MVNVRSINIDCKRKTIQNDNHNRFFTTQRQNAFLAGIVI